MIKFLAIVALAGIAFAVLLPIPPGGNVSGRRVIGGADTSIEKAPYQVSIHGIDHENKTYGCGGSIIAKNWVLTAAHCTDKPIHFTVRAGSSKRDSGGSIHKVSRIIIHEEYYRDPNTVPTNDIALFQVEPPFRMDSTRRPIELFESNEEAEVGTYSLITGWGQILPTFQLYPEFLQRVNLPIISKAKCKKAYANFTKLNPGQICTAYPKGGKDACQGDSGGPLVMKGRLAGIVSWGHGCAVAEKPGVYTEVAYFRDWIDESMDDTMEE